MKKTMTELVFILDKSGSMAGLESDTIGGYNAMLAKQQSERNAGNARITTVLFDTSSTLLHDRLDLEAVAPLTTSDYAVGGSTALLDAIGLAIEKISKVQAASGPDYQADQVLMVITTDGMENASRHFNAAQIKGMIERQKREWNWEFIFLGANIDAVEVAGRFGIAEDRAQNYHADESGTRLNFTTVASAISGYRAKGALEQDWSAPIAADYKQRSGGNPQMARPPSGRGRSGRPARP